MSALHNLGDLYDRIGTLIATPGVGREAPMQVEGTNDDDDENEVQAFIARVDVEARCDQRLFALFTIVPLSQWDEAEHGRYDDPRPQPEAGVAIANVMTSIADAARREGGDEAADVASAFLGLSADATGVRVV